MNKDTLKTIINKHVGHAEFEIYEAIDEYTESLIPKVNVKSWSKSDIENILFRYANDHALLSCKTDICDFNEWIKQNL